MLWSFNGGNGAYPQSDLVLSPDGAFYGTTYNGGTNDYGTVFRVTADGQLTTLVFFNGTNGASSYTALASGNDGSLYVTTSSGGTLGGGNIFRLSVAPRNSMLPLTRNGNSWNVSFKGPTATAFLLQRATNLAGPWTIVTNITTAADGTAQYLDSAPPAARGFYRTANP